VSELSIAEAMQRLAQRIENRDQRAPVPVPREVTQVDRWCAWGIPRTVAELLETAQPGTYTAVETQYMQRDGLVLLVLSGEPGTGKTIASALWLTSAQTGKLDGALASRRDVKPPLFARASVLERAWRANDRELIGSAEKSRRLVVDELGADGDDRGRFAAFVEALLCDRHADGLPTVITTNLDSMQFKTRFSSRLVDRIREAGRFVTCKQRLRQEAPK
jgi:hypothetical protein